MAPPEPGAGSPRDAMSGRRLSRGELCYAFGAAGLLVVLALSASIRHSVLCESGPAEDTEAAAHLARQALDARLLGVEQETLETRVLVGRVLAALDAELGSTDRALDARDGGGAPRAGDVAASFADLFADAEKLAGELDAALDRADDEAARRDPPPPAPAAARDDWAFPAGADDAARPVEFEADDAARGPGGLDDFSRARDAARYRDDPGAAAEAESARARCELLAADYGVVPAVTWGDAPTDAQDEWRRLECDLLVN